MLFISQNSMKGLRENCEKHSPCPRVALGPVGPGHWHVQFRSNSRMPVLTMKFLKGPAVQFRCVGPGGVNYWYFFAILHTFETSLYPEPWFQGTSTLQGLPASTLVTYPLQCTWALPGSVSLLVRLSASATVGARGAFEHTGRML